MREELLADGADQLPLDILDGNLRVAKPLTINFHGNLQTINLTQPPSHNPEPLPSFPQ